jgi:ATP-dependent DNA ligase
MTLARALLFQRQRCAAPGVSSLIDGLAVACDENGLAVFERLRRKPSGKHVFLYAFDLNDTDLRREPLETRKATLASLLRRSLPGLRLNEQLGRLGSRYRSGRSKDWSSRIRKRQR